MDNAPRKTATTTEQVFAVAMSAGAIARQQSVQLEAAILYGPFVHPAYSMPLQSYGRRIFQNNAISLSFSRVGQLGADPERFWGRVAWGSDETDLVMSRLVERRKIEA